MTVVTTSRFGVGLALHQPSQGIHALAYDQRVWRNAVIGEAVPCREAENFYFRCEKPHGLRNRVHLPVVARDVNNCTWRRQDERGKEVTLITFRCASDRYTVTCFEVYFIYFQCHELKT